MAYEKVIERLRKRVAHGLTPVPRDELRSTQHGILWECYASRFVLPQYTHEEKVSFLTHRVDDKISKPRRIEAILAFCETAYEILGGKKVGTCHIRTRDMDVFLKHARQAGYDADTSPSISKTLYSRHQGWTHGRADDMPDYWKDQCRRQEELENAFIAKMKAQREREALQSERLRKKQERVSERQRLAEYTAAVKKQRRNQPDAATRRKAHDELEEKMHTLYRERHGHDTAHITLDERRELYAIIRADTEQRRRQEERELAAERQRQKREADLLVTHKARLAPNNLQKAYLQKCFGTARFCYNWAFDQWEAANRRGERVFASELEARFNADCKTEYPWVYAVTHYARTTGFSAFERAQQAMFDGKGAPRRRRYKLGTGSLYYVVTGKRKEPALSDRNLDLTDSQPSRRRQYLFVPGLGYVKMMERLRFQGLLTSVTIKQQADGHYYACLNVYISRSEWQRTHPHLGGKTVSHPIGIDLGLATFATLSTGLKISAPAADPRLQERKKQLQRVIRHKHDSHPRHTSKAQRRLAWHLAKTTAALGRQRRGFLHRLTTALAYHCEAVAVECLNIRDMMDTDRRAGAMLQAAFYQFRTLLEQKMLTAGYRLHVADRYLPTTRTSSRCGCIGQPLPLTERTFRCADCGAEIDRDVNAAINLSRLLGLDEPHSPAAANRLLTAVLTRVAISPHQATEEKQAGCAP